MSAGQRITVVPEDSIVASHLSPAVRLSPAMGRRFLQAFERAVEARQVLEPGLERDREDAAVRPAEEAFGMADSEAADVVGPGRAGHFAEESGKSAAAHAQLSGDPVQPGRLEEAMAEVGDVRLDRAAQIGPRLG